MEQTGGCSTEAPTTVVVSPSGKVVGVFVEMWEMSIELQSFLLPIYVIQAPACPCQREHSRTIHPVDFWVKWGNTRIASVGRQFLGREIEQVKMWPTFAAFWLSQLIRGLFEEGMPEALFFHLCKATISWTFLYHTLYFNEPIPCVWDRMNWMQGCSEVSSMYSHTNALLLSKKLNTQKISLEH